MILRLPNLKENAHFLYDAKENKQKEKINSFAHLFEGFIVSRAFYEG